MKVTTTDVEGYHLAARFFLEEMRRWGNYQQRGSPLLGYELLRSADVLEGALGRVRTAWELGEASPEETCRSISELAAVLFDAVGPSRLYAEFVDWSASGELERRVEAFEREYRGSFA